MSSHNSSRQASNGDDEEFFVVDAVEALPPGASNDQFGLSAISDVERGAAPPALTGRPITDLVALAKFGITFVTRNGQLSHKTPVPPPSDVAELRYVSALMQCSSMQTLRQDCSIHAEEISYYLKSRHGLDVSPKVVQTVILEGGLTADRDDESAEGGDGAGGILDLCELTSALLIPNLTMLANNHTGDNVNILDDALKLMMEDCTGDTSPKPLNEDLVRDILISYGEGRLAEDTELVQQMINVATESGGTTTDNVSGQTLLDSDAFASALTSDVCRKYDPQRNKRRTTNFHDVWFLDGEQLDDKNSGIADIDEETAPHDGIIEQVANIREETVAEAFKLDRCAKRKAEGGGQDIDNEGKRPQADSDSGRLSILYTGPSFDFFADTYRTRLHVVFLWVSFVTFYLAYSLTLPFSPYSYKPKHCEGDDLTSKVVCPLVAGITTQLLTIVQVIIFGTPFVCLGANTNSIEERESPKWSALCLLLFSGYVLTFFLLEFTIPWMWSTESSPNIETVQSISLVFAMIVVSLQTLNLFTSWLKKLQLFMCSAFRNVNYESKIKQSAICKVDKMLSNAYDVHRCAVRAKPSKGASTDKSTNRLSNRGMALNEYAKRADTFTYIGGIYWTWKRIWSGALFECDGIWLSARMITGTAAQILVIIVVPIGAYFALPVLEQQINPTATVQGEPSAWAMISAGVALFCGFFASVSITILFLPSVVATTLKFRRGIFDVTQSENFLCRYRFALDQATLLVPGMLYGCLFSSLSISLLAGGFIYLCVWDQTQKAIFGMIGNLIGLSCVLVVKIFIMQVIRFSHMRAFYRIKPLSSNIINVCLECYGFAVALWFMMVRFIKIIVIAALYLGRVDTTLFSQGVGVFGPLELDNWPTVTRREILAHEAHRHPYIETLGYIYMMQLKYHDQGYAKRACSAWRLVFVLAFMPWLQKHRDSAKPGHYGRTKKRSTALAKSIISPQWLQSKTVLLIDEEEDELEDRAASLVSEISRLQAELSAVKSKMRKAGNEHRVQVSL